jgi:cob(I)alamin adenosyltransferase
MSIATMRGDGGETGLAGGIRVSKSHSRVEAYGTIDELISTMGFARAICADEEIRVLTKKIQKELFAVGSAIATPPESRKKPPEVTDALVDALTAQVHRIESIEGILGDWSIPGEHPASAAYDVARTVCRRAERLVVGLPKDGIKVQPNVLRYLNRLSDLLWLIGRLLELRAGVDAKLRDPGHKGGKWSRAW